ncbi:LEA type 2 family protein [Chloroflexota bacterium]
MKKWILLSLGAIACAVIIFIVFLNVCKLPEAINLNKPEIGKPEIIDVSLDWGKVTEATTEVLGTITVYNPNSIPIPVRRITCDIKINGTSICSAETIDLQIEEKSEFPINITAEIDNTKIPDIWAEHINRNEKSEASIELLAIFDLGGVDFPIPYTIKQPIETDLLSYLEQIEPIPVEKKIEIPILGERTVFRISLESLSGKWGPTTPQTTQIDLLANVYNDNLYPLLAPKVRCTIESNGLSLGSGETGAINTFLPKSNNDVEIVATLNSDLMDDWLVRHIQQGEKSSFNIKVLMVFEVSQEVLEFIGQDDLSITLWEGTKEVETDILAYILGEGQ